MVNAIKHFHVLYTLFYVIDIAVYIVEIKITKIYSKTLSIVFELQHDKLSELYKIKGKI